MGRDLIANLTSEYIQMSSAFVSKKQPKKILVYVESDDDIKFWRHILQQFETKYIKFDIQLPCKEHLEKGKTNIFQNFKKNIGEYLIFCIDSDYDSFLEDSTENSYFINNNPFLFQTYSYSIENLICYAPSLQLLCVNSTACDQINIDLESLVVKYSNIIYPLLVWSIFLVKKEQYDTFSISNFSDCIKLLSANLEDEFENDLLILEDSITKKVNELEEIYKNFKEEKDNFEKSLIKKGLDKDHCYLNAHGHTIKDNFILMILKPICAKVIKNKYQFIRNKAKDQEQLVNEINRYKQQVIKVESLIDTHFNFNKSTYYNNIKKDLESFMDKYHTSHSA